MLQQMMYVRFTNHNRHVECIQQSSDICNIRRATIRIKA